MMIRLGLILWAVCAYGQTVSSITFDGVGDSSVRMIFNVSASFNALRVRYGTSSCASGSGGTVQLTGTNAGTYVLIAMTADLSGLAPSTLYHACPEVSSDGGSTWSSGADATFTTLARTQTLPLPPAPVSTTFPAQTGSTLNVAADCSNLQAQINAAVAGDTIVIPAGTVCTGAYTTPRAPEAKTFGPSSVVTSTSTLAIPAHGFTENQEVHFSSDGANTACLPGMTIFPANWALAGYNCDKGGGWGKGPKYFVHVPDADHVQILNAVGGTPVVPGWINFTADPVADTITFIPTLNTPGGYATVSGSVIPANTQVQFVSSGTLPGGLALDTTYFLLTPCAATPNAACVTQVSLSSGGAAVNITSAGTGTHTIVDRGLGNMYIAPAPTQAGPWILIETGGTLPPAGTRIDNTTDAQLFHLRKTTYDIIPEFTPGILAHNWRIRGAIFDTGTNTDYLTSTDPRPFCGGPTTNQDNRYIVFDQDRIQGPGYPNRFACRNGGANMFWDGGYISVINSDLRGLDFWHPWYGATTGLGGGLVPTRVSGSQVTATPGVGHGGVFTTTTTGTAFINFTGGAATGTAFVYFAMDGTMAVLAPTGTTGNCSVTGTTCVFSTAASPDWPVDANGRRAALALFTITLAAGSVTGVAGANPTFAPGPPALFEGASAIIAGAGPGPYLISNNYISGAGLTVHFDDGGGPLTARGDYNITRNTFDVPARYLLSSANPSSDGLWYGNRQPLEWKGGQRILISGNIFRGCFAQINNIGTCIIMTPRTGGTVTDVNISNNQFMGVGGAIMIASPPDTFAPVSIPAARQSFSNNLAMINAWTQHVPAEAQPNGFFFYGSNAVEDLTVSHNTIYDSRGAAPSFIHWVAAPVGGVSITDNIYFYTGNASALQSEIIPNCTFTTNKAMMDCAFTAGPGNPSYTFSRNLLVPSWSDTSIPSGFVGAAAVQNAFPAPLLNFIPTGNSVAANLNIIKFVSAPPPGSSAPIDLRLAAGSPYQSNATDGTQVGANMDQLQQAQGIIGQLRALAVGPTAATISAFVPDPGVPCYVGYGTSSDRTGWTWSSADTTASRQRNIPISGLVSGTQYFYSLGCANTSFPPTANLRTQ